MSLSHVTVTHVLAVSKVTATFLPGTVILAVGAEGVASNPLTVNDVALMLAGISLIWFGGVMLKTRDIVAGLVVRVKALEARDTAEDQARITAAATSAAVTVALEGAKTHRTPTPK